MAVILRDGVMYFVGMLVAEITDFVVFTNISPDLIAINWTYNSTVTIVLLSRLVLNLRAERSTLKSAKDSIEAASLPWSLAVRRTSTMSSVVIGNLGAPLHTSASPLADDGMGNMLLRMETISEKDDLDDEC